MKDFQRYSNTELLSMMLGTTVAHSISSQPLSTLFGITSKRWMVCESDADCGHEKLLVAGELMKRALYEEISHDAVSLSSPKVVMDYLRVLLGGREQEVFVAIFLDAQHRVIASEEMFHGTLTQTSVYPREVVKRALHHNAAAVMFCHNHPSGVTEPSRSDQLLTDALKQALTLVDVRVLDHFIVGDSEILSFAEKGLI